MTGRPLRVGTKAFCLAVATAVLIRCSSGSLIITPASSTLATAGPDLSVSVKTVYYSIYGATASELRAQMDQSGPRGFDAYTAWYVSWSYPHTVADNQCATGPVTVKVEVTLTMPQWNVPPGAPQELVDKWTAYLAALQLHEDGHTSIAIEARNEILRALQTTPSYSTCADLDRAINATGQGLLDRYRQQEALYDQTTERGMTQGARFP